jgi:hypothetical protein
MMSADCELAPPQESALPSPTEGDTTATSETVRRHQFLPPSGVLGPEEEPSVFETRGVLVFGGGDYDTDYF